MIGYEVKIRKKRIEQALLDTIKKQEKSSIIEINSFKLTLELVELPILEVNHKTIGTRFPIKFKINKDDFLFSIQSHGQLYLNLDTDFDISSDFMLTTKTSIKNYTWIEEPQVDFGSLNITVEHLVNLIINHYKESISIAIDKSIKDYVDLNSLITEASKAMESKLNDFSYKGIRPFISPIELLIEPFTTVDDVIIIKGALIADIALGNSSPFIKNILSLRWVETYLNDSIAFIDIKIREEVISEMLCEFINQQEYGGETLFVSGCYVDFKKNNVDISMDLMTPIKAKVVINGAPIYNEHNSTLNINNLNVEVNPSGFLHKLSAPLLNKFITSNIKNRLPVDLDALLKESIKSYLIGNFEWDDIHSSYQVGRIEIKEVLYDDAGIYLKLKASDLSVKVIA
jgi:hypothetical protein